MASPPPAFLSPPAATPHPRRSFPSTHHTSPTRPRSHPPSTPATRAVRAPLTLRRVWEPVASDIAALLGGAAAGASASVGVLAPNAAPPTVSEVASAVAGGTVGVMGTLTALEVVKQQAKERKQCPYCRGQGLLPCGRCFTVGSTPSPESSTGQEPCGLCGEKGYVECNHCEGTGRLIPIEYERALRAQFEDYTFASTYEDDYYVENGPPYS